MTQNLTWNEALIRMRINHKKMVAPFMVPGDYWTCDDKLNIINSNGAVIHETYDPQVLHGEWSELITAQQFNLMNRVKQEALSADGEVRAFVLDLGSDLDKDNQRFLDNMKEVYREELDGLKREIAHLKNKLLQLEDKR